MLYYMLLKITLAHMCVTCMCPRTLWSLLAFSLVSLEKKIIAQLVKHLSTTWKTTKQSGFHLSVVKLKPKLLFWPITTDGKRRNEPIRTRSMESAPSAGKCMLEKVARIWLSNQRAYRPLS